MKSNGSPYYSVGSVSKSTNERWDLAHRLLRPALLTGSAFFLLGAILFAGEFAAAMGGNPLATVNTAPSFEPLPSALPMVPQFGLERSRDHVRLERSRDHVRFDWLRDRHRARKRTASLGSRSAVCVRLCDGFYFPSVVSSGGDEACASQCPDAPTAFYSMPAGSDKIDDAVSLTGAPYSALPVANRNQRVIARPSALILLTSCMTAPYAMAIW